MATTQVQAAQVRTPRLPGSSWQAAGTNGRPRDIACSPNQAPAPPAPHLVLLQQRLVGVGLHLDHLERGAILLRWREQAGGEAGR